MKKLIIAAVIIVAGIYAGSAFMLGGQVEDRYFEALKDNEQFGVLSFSNQKYERGFFSSSAQTLVTVVIPEPADDGATDARNASFVVRHVFRHGPLPDMSHGFSFRPGLAAVESTVDTSGGQGALFTEIPELAQSSSVMRIGFGGEVDGDFEVPAFDKEIDGESVNWGGLVARARYVPDSGSFRGDMTMPSLILKSSDGTLRMDGFSSTFDLVEALPLVFVGQVKADMSSINMTRTDGDAVSVGELRFSSNSSCDGTRVEYAQSVNIGSVAMGGATHGPVICDMEARNLDAAALSEFQIQFQQLYRSMPTADVDMLAEQIAELYGKLFTKLMAGSPEFRISRLQVLTSMGEFTGTLSIRLDAPGEGAALNPLLLLQHVNASVAVAVHEALLKGLMVMSITQQQPAANAQDVEAMVQQLYSQQVETLLGRNLIVRDGETITSEASFVQGKLRVNGQEMPLF